MEGRKLGAFWYIVPLFALAAAVVVISISGRKSEEMLQSELDAEEIAALQEDER